MTYERVWRMRKRKWNKGLKLFSRIYKQFKSQNHSIWKQTLNPCCIKDSMCTATDVCSIELLGSESQWMLHCTSPAFLQRRQPPVFLYALRNYCTWHHVRCSTATLFYLTSHTTLHSHYFVVLAVILIYHELGSTCLSSVHCSKYSIRLLLTIFEAGDGKYFLHLTCMHQILQTCHCFVTKWQSDWWQWPHTVTSLQMQNLCVSAY